MHVGPITDEELGNHAVARQVVYALEASALEIWRGDYVWTWASWSDWLHDADMLALHAFLKSRIRYNPDQPGEVQRIRAPWATLIEGEADCKSTAIFLGSIALAQGRHVAVRFTNEDGGEHWSHVYVIVDGIACDPLLKYGQHPVQARACTYVMPPLASLE